MKKAIGLAALTNRLNVPQDSNRHWQTARVWDRWLEESRPRVGLAYAAQRQKTAALVAALDSPLTVLELCCGTGRLAFDLLHSPNVAHLFEVDISPAAIDRLQTQLQAHPRQLSLEAWVGNVLQLPAAPNRQRFDVIICLDALPNLSWSALPGLFEQVSLMLKPGGLFVGNYLSSENIDAHTANKHGQLGYWRIVGRLLLGTLLSRVRPSLAGQKGLLRTGTAYRADVQQLLEASFTVRHLETGVYHWFAATPRERVP